MMNIRRTLWSLKGLLTVAVMAGFLIPLSSTSAQAFGSCPCNFTSTLWYGKQTARTFDSKFDLCTVRTDDRILLTTQILTAAEDRRDSCGLSFEVRNDELRAGVRNGEGGVCAAEVVCGGVFLGQSQELQAPEEGIATLRTEWNLTEREVKSCQRELKWLIRLSRAPQCELLPE